MRRKADILVAVVLWGASLGLAYWWGGKRTAMRGDWNEVAVPQGALLSGGVLPPSPLDDAEGLPSAGQGTVRSEKSPSTVAAVIDAMYEKATGGLMNPSRLVAVFAALEELPTEKMGEALRMIDALPDFEHKQLLYAAALARWGEGDGASAADYVSTQVDPKERPGLLGAVFSSWAAQDSEAAWAWFEGASRSSDGDPKQFAHLLPHLFHGLATENLDAAFDRLASLGSGDLVSGALKGMAASLQSDAGRLAYLEKAVFLERPEDRVTAQQAVLGRWVKEDPGAAIAWVEGLEMGAERREVAKGVTHAWFGDAPEEAAGWYLTQVPEEETPKAVHEIVQRWVRDDPNAAGNWLGQFDAGPESNEARAAFSQAIVGIDPESAVQWSLSIEHPEMREKSLLNVYKQWQRREPEVANEAIRQSALPHEQVEKLLSVGNDP